MNWDELDFKFKVLLNIETKFAAFLKGKDKETLPFLSQCLPLKKVNAMELLKLFSRDDPVLPRTSIF